MAADDDGQLTVPVEVDFLADEEVSPNVFEPDEDRSGDGLVAVEDVGSTADTDRLLDAGGKIPARPKRVRISQGYLKNLIVNRMEQCQLFIVNRMEQCQLFIVNRMEQCQLFIVNRMEQCQLFIVNRIEQCQLFIVNRMEQCQLFIVNRMEQGQLFIVNRMEQCQLFIVNRMEQCQLFIVNRMEQCPQLSEPHQAALLFKP